MSAAKNIFTYELDEAAQKMLSAAVEGGNYRRREVEYALWSVEGDHVNVTLYAREKHGKRKLVVQGRGAADFVSFVLEPSGAAQVSLGYEEVVDPAFGARRGGSDESGKGDYFGPLVVCCAYADGELSKKMADLGVRDCKQMSDSAVLKTGEALRSLLKPDGYAMVRIAPPAYNRLYAKIGNSSRILAWAHATAIEDLLKKRPGVEFVTVDQFAPTEKTVSSELKPLGRKTKIVQRHKAESDMAVAAASVVAREAFLRDVQRLSEESGFALPLGASDPSIKTVAAAAVSKHGAKWLMNNAKVHFRTTDAVLESLSMTRDDLPPEGRVSSIAVDSDKRGTRT